MKFARQLIVLSLALILCGPAQARTEQARIAVASNFATTAEALVEAFEDETSHDITLVIGSTGRLYAQIINGAPYDAFLAADRYRPQRLEADGRAVAGSRFTYATGTLTLWSATAFDADETWTEVLGGLPAGQRLAVANPDLAPYGAAARQALEATGLWDRLEGRIVYGESVGQAFAFAAQGNAGAGLIARAQRPAAGHTLDIPHTLHDPVHQDAVLLSRAAQNEAARAFLTFLRSPEAQAAMRSHGYRVDK